MSRALHSHSARGTGSSEVNFSFNSEAAGSMEEADAESYKKPTHEAVWWAENEPSIRRVGTRRDPLGVSELAEHGTPDLNRVRPPFIQVLVQKSVTTITNVVGRLTTWMLSESCGAAQGERRKNLALWLRIGRVPAHCRWKRTIHHTETPGQENALCIPRSVGRGICIC